MSEARVIRSQTQTPEEPGCFYGRPSWAPAEQPIPVTVYRSLTLGLVARDPHNGSPTRLSAFIWFGRVPECVVAGGDDNPLRR